MSEFYQALQTKREEISPDHAFRILNTFINYPCIKYARRVLTVLPQIRAYTRYYEQMLREKRISEYQKGIVVTFISEYYHALELLKPLMVEIQRVEAGAMPTC